MYDNPQLMMQLQGHQPDTTIDTQKHVTVELNTTTDNRFTSFQTVHKHFNRHIESNKDYFEASG